MPSLKVYFVRAVRFYWTSNWANILKKKTKKIKGLKQYKAYPS